MAVYSEFYFPSSDRKTSIHVNRWLPDGEVKAVVQICHGVAEYGFRYERFALFLAQNGYAVFANDHLGHGKSVIEGAPPLYFGEAKGWLHVVDDVEKLRRTAKEQFKNKPYFIFGHSMGSFILRSHLIRYPGRTDGAIICGTGYPSSFVIKSGKLAAGIRIHSLGKKGFSKMVDNIAFGSYNKKFKPNRTQYDWLSLNEENVDRYINDPMCGGKVSLGLFSDMLDGLELITDKGKISLMDKKQPVLFIAGENDPVGDMGKGVKKAYEAFKNAGVRDVSIKLYPRLRHEILNEENYMEVQNDILSFLEEKQKKIKAGAGR